MDNKSILISVIYNLKNNYNDGIVITTKLTTIKINVERGTWNVAITHFKYYVPHFAPKSCEKRE